MKVEFNKMVECPWTEKKVKKIIDIAAKAVAAVGEVEVNIIGEKLIKKLNLKYRGINRVTDVLSFAWKEDKLIKTESLGEIYLCYKKIKNQAKEFNVTPREEFVRILTHGFLHLLGCDHQTKNQAQRMFSLQENIVRKYFK